MFTVGKRGSPALDPWGVDPSGIRYKSGEGWGSARGYKIGLTFTNRYITEASMQMTVPTPAPPPPEGLSEEAVTLWTSWHQDLAEDMEADAREIVVLTQAARHLTLCNRLEAELRNVDQLVISGSRDNLVMHPLVPEVDRLRKSVATLLKSIAQPPDRSEVNRKNVNTRWSRRSG